MWKFRRVRKWHLELLKWLSAPQRKALLQNYLKATRSTQAENLMTAIRAGVLSVEEYSQQYKDRYLNENGTDSFTQYLLAVMHVRKIEDPTAIFMTNNARMLANREILTDRFGVVIKSLSEMLEAAGINADAS